MYSIPLGGISCSLTISTLFSHIHSVTTYRLSNSHKLKMIGSLYSMVSGFEICFKLFVHVLAISEQISSHFTVFETKF